MRLGIERVAREDAGEKDTQADRELKYQRDARGSLHSVVQRQSEHRDADAELEEVEPLDIRPWCIEGTQITDEVGEVGVARVQESHHSNESYEDDWSCESRDGCIANEARTRTDPWSRVGILPILHIVVLHPVTFLGLAPANARTQRRRVASSAGVNCSAPLRSQ